MSLPQLLLLTPDFPPALGGIQRLLCEFAERLSAIWDVTVVAPRQTGAAAWDDGRPFRVVRTRTAWGGARSAGTLAEMAAIAARTSSDLLVAGHIAVLPAAVAGAKRRPLATFLYGGELWAPWAPHLLRLGSRVQLWLSISRFTADEVAKLGVPPARIELTPLGADRATRPADWRERLDQLGLLDGNDVRPFFVTIGRLHEPHKGQDVIVRSLPAIVSRRPEVRYVIGGDGRLRAHLEQLAADGGVDREVVISGVVHEPLKGALLSTCRAFVMPSRATRAAGQYEGFGIAYIEAALAGVPSVGSKEGAVPEVVLDEETGLLADARDPASVADAVLRLLDDPEGAAELGARARSRAEAQFTWEVSAARVDRVLTTML